MPHFQIKSRFYASVLFEGEFGSLKLCVEAAVSAGANLAGADLAGADLARADLTRAYLAGADLAGANVIDAGTPNGWRVVGWLQDGYLAIRVGCRNKRLGEAREYWNESHPFWSERQEIPPALDYVESVAKLRGWALTAEQKEAA